MYLCLADVCRVWRSLIESGVGPLSVVEANSIVDDLFRLEAIGELMQIDCLLLQGSLEPLDENVVQVAAPPIPRDFNIGLRQCRDPIYSQILTTMIRIHDLGHAIFGDGFVQRFNRNPGIHRI